MLTWMKGAAGSRTTTEVSTADPLPVSLATLPVTGSLYASALAVAADSNALVAAAAGLRLMGYSCRESAGTPAVATLRIVEGATGAGAPVVIVELAANASAAGWFGPGGILVPAGLSIDWIVGTVDVILYYRVEV